MADHPVKVPPEVFAELLSEAMEKTSKPSTVAAMVADRAAQLGADQQLEEVNDWIRCLGDHSETGIRWELSVCQLDRLSRELWQAMRPKPPTLAEQGLEALRSTPCAEQRHYDALFAALNRLAELDAQQ